MRPLHLSEVVRGASPRGEAERAPEPRRNWAVLDTDCEGGCRDQERLPLAEAAEGTGPRTPPDDCIISRPRADLILHVVSI